MVVHQHDDIDILHACLRK